MKKTLFAMMTFSLTSCGLFSPPSPAVPFPNINFDHPVENWLGDTETLTIQGTLKSPLLDGYVMMVSWQDSPSGHIGQVNTTGKQMEVTVPQPDSAQPTKGLDGMSGFETGVKLYTLDFNNLHTGALPNAWVEGDVWSNHLNTYNSYVYSPQDVTYVKINRNVPHRGEVHVSVKLKKGWNKIYQQHDMDHQRVLITTSHKYQALHWESIWDSEQDPSAGTPR